MKRFVIIIGIAMVVAIVACCKNRDSACAPAGCGSGFICDENIGECICPSENFIYYNDCVPKWEGLYIKDAFNNECDCLSYISAVWIDQLGAEQVLRLSLDRHTGSNNSLGSMPIDVFEMEASNNSNYEFADILFGYGDNLPCKYNNKFLTANFYYNIYEDSIVMKVDFFDFVPSGLYPENPEIVTNCNLKFVK